MLRQQDVVDMMVQVRAASGIAWLQRACMHQLDLAAMPSLSHAGLTSKGPGDWQLGHAPTMISLSEF